MPFAFACAGGRHGERSGLCGACCWGRDIAVDPFVVQMIAGTAAAAGQCCSTSATGGPSVPAAVDASGAALDSIEPVPLQLD